MTESLTAMKCFYRISALMLAALLFACAPKPPVPVELDAGEKMFRSAEQDFQEKSYEKALGKYRSYYREYPQRLNAPAALLKIGEILILQKKMSAARDTFTRLITEFPDSLFALDAKIAILVTYFNEGAFGRIIPEAEKIPEDRLSSFQALRLYTLLADVSTQLGTLSDAFYYAGKALARAPDHEKPALRQRLKDLVQQLDPDAMAALLDRIGNIEARGLLLIRLDRAKIIDIFSFRWNNDQKSFDSRPILLINNILRKMMAHDVIEKRSSSSKTNFTTSRLFST